MLVKIITLVATAAILGVVLYPFVAPMLTRAWVPAAQTHFCDRCTRGYRDATTLAWHRTAMHPELAVEILDDGEHTVGPVRPLLVIVDDTTAAGGTPAATAPVTEIRSGGRVYRVINGGRK
jgi:hypothetical protein